MKAKATKVQLKAGEIVREFDFVQAERLLRMRNNGGWELPEKSKFEFKENALRYRQDKKSDTGKQEGGCSEPCETASVKDKVSHD